MLLILLVGHHVAREGLQWNDLGRKESRIIEGKLKKGKIKLQGKDKGTRKSDKENIFF